ncbi:hypothetical protein G7054_g8919 [Neopestalotiopsis clavispora]|nr:hypothetical protein G7054_g8919 [Neopestalotiopsis clavispora]
MIWHLASNVIMSQVQRSLEARDMANESRQHELWGWLVCFLVISNLSIVGRLWGTWKSVSTRSKVVAEDVFIGLSGIILNAIIGNLMAATHYGLGLHGDRVNELDMNYPSNLSNAFKRLFLCSSPALRIFWWTNIGYIGLWFFGSTSFYVFQCRPVQWYFLQYYNKYKHPVPGDVHGQCDATTVVHVAMPMVFSLVSDVALLVLPLWAISKLRVDRKKRIGLMAVFGIGLVACLLELARILALIIDTDDKTDPSWGVAVFLILTAAEETTAVVCACLPIIGPLLYRHYRIFRGKSNKSRSTGNTGSLDVEGQNHVRSSSRNWRSRQSFKRVMSVNHIPTSIGGLTKMDGTIDGDRIHLTSIEAKPPRSIPESFDTGLDVSATDGKDDVETNTIPSRSVIGVNNGSRTCTPFSNAIHVRTDVEVEVVQKNENANRPR